MNQSNWIGMEPRTKEGPMEENLPRDPQGGNQNPTEVGREDEGGNLQEEVNPGGMEGVSHGVRTCYGQVSKPANC